MRLRKSAYEASARFRSEHTGRKIAEPTTIEGMFINEESPELTDVYDP